MDLIWQSVVIISVLIVLLIAWRFFAFAKSLLRTLSANPGATSQSPTRIHLTVCPNPPWLNPEQIAIHKREINSIGLADLACFTVEEMPGLLLQGYMQVETGTLAVVYERKGMGIWLDLIRYFQDGSSLTVSNTPIGAELRHKPGHEKIRSPGADLARLHKILQEKERNLAIARFEKSDAFFKSHFEKAYAEEIDWRNSIGGPSEEEIRAIARTGGSYVPEQAILETVKRMRRQACDGLVVAFDESFRKKSEAASDPTWQEKADRIVYVHDKLTEELLKEILSKAKIDLPQSQDAIIRSKLPREAFEEIVSMNASGSSQFKKIDQLDYPLIADVYELVWK